MWTRAFFLCAKSAPPGTADAKGAAGRGACCVLVVYFRKVWYNKCDIDPAGTAHRNGETPREREKGAAMLRKRGLGLLAALACCALLCACDSLVAGGNVEELLRAPRPSERQNAVQTALNAYLGESLQLKYPRGGGEPDPVIFADLDGDGSEEAAVLYTAPSKGQNVHLAVLERGEEGWDVAYEVMGLSTEVAEVELVELFEGSVQLCVGYATRI